MQIWEMEETYAVDAGREPDWGTIPEYCLSVASTLALLSPSLPMDC